MIAPPFFRIDAKDFVALSPTIDMTLEERGLFVTLLAYEWISGSLPEREHLPRIARVSERRFKKLWINVGEEFVAQDDGRLINLALEEQRDAAMRLTIARRASGRLGGNSRNLNGFPISERACRTDAEGRGTISKSTRFTILQRDGFACRYCGRSGADVELHVDHVVSVADGGATVPENLVTACADCNLGKSSRSVGVLFDACRAEA